MAELVLPTFGWSPPAASSFGAEAVDLAASAGLLLDPWQAYSLEQILGEQADGRPAAFEACMIVPRQNGKGSVLEALSLAWLFLTEAPLILHSAHEFKTAAEAFRRLRALVMRTPHLARRVEKITTAAGNEAIELASGQRLRYVARSDKSAIGFTSGKLILDEAFAIDAEEMAAMLPTLSTQPEAQLVYTSSAGKTASSQLRGLRDRGRAGGDASLCYLEWGGRVDCPVGCMHDLDNESCALNDRALWASSNPSWEIYRDDGTQGITQAYVENERRSLVLLPEKFARERTGAWDAAPAGSVAPISIKAWQALADPDSRRAPDSRVALAVDVARDRQSAAIAWCGRREDDRLHVEVVRHARGTGWLVPALAELAGKVPLLHVEVKDREWRPAIVADKLALDALGPELKDAGLEPWLLGVAQVAAACAGLQDDVEQGQVRHLGQHQLDSAVSGASKRDVGDGGWAWGKKATAGSVDISPLYAVTLARWAFLKAPKPYDLSQSFG